MCFLLAKEISSAIEPFITTHFSLAMRASL